MKYTIEAIVFDLYGILLRVPGITSFSFLKANIPDGIISRNQWKTLLLKRDYKDIDQFLEVISKSYCLSYDLKQQFKYKLWKELESVELYKDTQETLVQLSERYPLYLMSNLASFFKQPVYDLGLDKFFKQIFFSCEVGLAKPDTSFFGFLSREVKLKSQNILIVGDNLISDYQGASLAGMIPLHLNRGKKLNTQVNYITTLDSLYSHMKIVKIR